MKKTIKATLLLMVIFFGSNLFSMDQEQPQDISFVPVLEMDENAQKEAENLIKFCATTGKYAEENEIDEYSKKLAGQLKYALSKEDGRVFKIVKNDSLVVGLASLQLAEKETMARIYTLVFSPEDGENIEKSWQQGLKNVLSDLQEICVKLNPKRDKELIKRYERNGFSTNKNIDLALFNLLLSHA